MTYKEEEDFVVFNKSGADTLRAMFKGRLISSKQIDCLLMRKAGPNQEKKKFNPPAVAKKPIDQ